MGIDGSVFAFVQTIAKPLGISFNVLFLDAGESVSSLSGSANMPNSTFYAIVQDFQF